MRHSWHKSIGIWRKAMSSAVRKQFLTCYWAPVKIKWWVPVSHMVQANATTFSVKLKHLHSAHAPRTHIWYQEGEARSQAEHSLAPPLQLHYHCTSTLYQSGLLPHQLQSLVFKDSLQTESFVEDLNSKNQIFLPVSSSNIQASRPLVGLTVSLWSLGLYSGIPNAVVCYSAILCQLTKILPPGTPYYQGCSSLKTDSEHGGRTAESPWRWTSHPVHF